MKTHPPASERIAGRRLLSTRWVGIAHRVSFAGENRIEGWPGGRKKETVSPFSSQK
jgi:hypothetical protein